jgi:Zn-dependent peptidase ImmA (M78 family)
VSTTAYITPDIVTWARERAGMSVAHLADALDEMPDRVRAWEEGFEFPTFGKAEKIAKRLRIPLGFLFLSAPPAADVPLPDLRTESGERPEHPSLDLIEIVQSTLLKQQWYSEYLQDTKGKRLRFVGSINLKTKPADAADAIRSVLAIDKDMRDKCKTWEKFKAEFIRRTEELGILVMQSGVAGYRRHLSVREFRGFAVVDDLAPAIFINSRDAKAAQIFTVAHELVHIWLGESGVSNPDPRKRSDEETNGIEQFCNKVAAELLVPTKEFYLYWKHIQTLEQNLRRLVHHFRVSRFVAVRQAYELKRIDKQQYLNYLEKNKGLWTPKGEIGRDEEERGGPQFYSEFTRQHSKTLVDGVLRALGQNRITYRDASALFGIRIATLKKVADRLI